MEDVPKPDGDLVFALEQLERCIQNGSCADAFVSSWDVNLSGKQAIARYIARNFVQEGLLVLDAGSTSFEIAKAIALHAQGVDKLHVLTNNLAISLFLISAGVRCTLLGGVVDTAHFCTLPDIGLTSISQVSQGQPYQAVITAAAISLSADGIAIRARKPDQFRFKLALLKAASTKIVAVDHTKWLLPFDGQHEFSVLEPGVHLVIDEDLQGGPPDSLSINDVCQRLGYHLHVVGSSPF